MTSPPVPHGAIVVGAPTTGAPTTGDSAAAAWAAAAATGERRPLVRARARHPGRALVGLSERAHLVVVGACRRGRLSSTVLGSCWSALVRRSRCPVVVVPDSAAPHHGHGVVVGVGGIPGSVSTLDFAFHAASRLGEPLTVVHCFWEAEHASGSSLASPPHSDLAEERLLVAETLAGLREGYPEVEVRVRIERGLAEHVLADLAHDAALVVVGGTRHGPLTDRTLGSVARTLLGRSPCPVAVVPRPRVALPGPC